MSRGRFQAPAADWIHLREIAVRCVLGVYPEERRKPRKVQMDVSLACDLRVAMHSDRLEDTLNYELVEAEVAAIAKQGKFFLIETLAERIAEACLRHKPVRAVRVAVDKPGALPRTRSVAVEIERRK
jgi:dihydroneopterin aldolase/D-erythro-7,8-dihydroneopterin triphosphate epimerase